MASFTTKKWRNNYESRRFFNETNFLGWDVTKGGCETPIEGKQECKHECDLYGKVFCENKEE